MNITLYHCRDTRSLRPLWMLEETGVPYQLLRMPFPPRFKHPDYLQINPLGTVPALRIDGDLMTESAAMCEFLAAFAQNGNLRVDPSEADYAAYLNWLHRSDTTLTFPLALILRYSKLEPPERRVPQVVEDYSRWFFKRAESVENALQHSDFLCGNRFTAADVCVGYAIFLAAKLGLSEDLGPGTRRYLQRLVARPAFQRADLLQADMSEVV